MLPEDFTLAMIVLLGLAVAFDYINGFHDTANAIATSVATRVLSPGRAVLMAGTLNFIGALSGTAVATTVGKGIVSAEVTTQRDSAALANLAASQCPGWDSNPHRTDFEAVASANWATGAADAG